ncbi:MAG: DUF4166 domain-containing protein [Microbacteriaceae bacterium]
MSESARRQSVYQRVLGDRFGELDEKLQVYFGMPPAGTVGAGSGMYDEAGSRLRWLRPVWAWLAWRRVLFPEHGRDVPFSVVNTPDARGGLRARRTFEFPRRRRVMVDRMSVVETADGPALHDRLGRRGGLEVRLRLDVVDGGLTMLSERLWLRVAALRVPLPRIARVTLTERTDGDRQRVDVRIHLPLLGEVFVYRGTFTYDYRSIS